MGLFFFFKSMEGVINCGQKNFDVGARFARFSSAHGYL